MVAGKQGQAAKVVEVAMGKQNKVDRVWREKVESGQGILPGIFGVQAGIQDELKGSDLTCSAVCPDPTVGI